jgi:hypothetical protein
VVFNIRFHQALARSSQANSGVGARKVKNLTGRFLQAHRRRVVGDEKVRLEIDARGRPGICAQDRFGPFVKPSRNVCYLRNRDVEAMSRIDVKRS